MALTQISTGMLASGDGTVDLNIDNGTFVVDVSSGNVGIGTSSPSSYFSPQLVVHSSVDLGGITIRSNATTDTNYLLFADGTSGNERYRGYVSYDHNADTMKLATGASPAITIISSGNVGIGTSPAYKLDVASAVIQFGDSTDAFAQYKSSAGNWHVGANSSNAFVFYSGTYGSGTERMRLDSSGNVQIGTGTPAYLVGTSDIAQLSVNRVGTSGAITNASRSAAYINLNGANGGSSIEFSTASANNTQPSEAMRINAAGNVGIGTGSPSTKLHLGGTAPLDSIIRQDSTVSGTNWEIGERSAGKWQIFEDDNDSVVATFTSSGNVGIGTSSPVNNSNRTTLGLQGAWGGQIDIMVGSTVHAQFGTDNFGSGQSCRIQSQDGIVFRAGGSSERMRIDSSGNLLVGGTSLNAASSVGFTAAGQIRQVFASGVANDSLFGAISGVSNGFQIVQDTSNNQTYKFHNGGTPNVTIDSSGDVTMPKKAYAYGTINGNPGSPAATYGFPLTTAAYQNCTPQTNSTHGPGVTITKAGFYILGMCLLYDPLSHNYVYLGWAVNGTLIHHWHSNHAVANNHDAVSQIGRYLNVGDHVTIEHANVTISTVFGNAHSSWYIAKIG